MSFLICRERKTPKAEESIETERIFAKAGANAEDISVAASRAKGMQYDGEKEVEAYEYGLEQRKKGNGEDLDLLIEATDYLDSTGEEVLLEISEETDVDKTGKNDIITSGARITDPYGDEGDAFAELYYEEVRHYSTDVERISGNLNLEFDDVRDIKKYLFEDNSLYDENTGKWIRFYPDCAIAHSWQRLMQGKDIKPHDITLIKHELYELQIKKKYAGISHAEAHKIATAKYNYQKEAEEYYASLKKHK